MHYLSSGAGFTLILKAKHCKKTWNWSLKARVAWNPPSSVSGSHQILQFRASPKPKFRSSGLAHRARPIGKFCGSQVTPHSRLESRFYSWAMQLLVFGSWICSPKIGCRSLLLIARLRRSLSSRQMCRSQIFAGVKNRFFLQSPANSFSCPCRLQSRDLSQAIRMHCGQFDVLAQRRHPVHKFILTICSSQRIGPLQEAALLCSRISEWVSEF